MSRAVVGGFFTQGSYNELRKFVINYIHTIAFEGNQEERAYDICMRSKSIQGWKINRYLFFLQINPEKKNFVQRHDDTVITENRYS